MQKKLEQDLELLTKEGMRVISYVVWPQGYAILWADAQGWTITKREQAGWGSDGWNTSIGGALTPEKAVAEYQEVIGKKLGGGAYKFYR
jgi:hypothetical protein